MTSYWLHHLLCFISILYCDLPCTYFPCVAAVVIAAGPICLTCTSLRLQLSISGPSRSNCQERLLLIRCYGSCNWPSQAQQSMPPLLPGFETPGPQMAGPAEAKGEVEVRLCSLLRLHRHWTAACLSVYRQLSAQHASALSVELIDTYRMCVNELYSMFLRASSFPSRCLINGAVFALLLMLPVKGSRCVQCTLEICASCFSFSSS